MDTSHKLAHYIIPYSENIGIFCPKCGYKGKPYKIRKGDLIAEVFLRCMFLYPGLVYTLRRNLNKICMCPTCCNEELLELNGDNQIVENLLKIQKRQNVCFFIVMILLFMSLIFYTKNSGQ